MNQATPPKSLVGKELHFLSVAEASRLIASRALSPVDLVEAFLARIEAVDGRIKSYITVLADRARAAARQAEAEIAAGKLRGPLHGIPFAVKDNYHLKGVRTTGGSRLMPDYVADTTSTIVARLEDAGAILLGKLNTWEYGTGNGGVYHDLPYEVARNPWDLECFTGGSSTGAGASVAAGTAMFALGSDTGGSIRLPAAACGLQGFKASFGLVSRAGCIPNCWSLDHTGPLTWTVEDSAIVLQAIAGYDKRDPSSAKVEIPDYRQSLHTGVKGLVIGVVRDLGPEGAALDASNAAAIEEMTKVLEVLGGVIKEVKLPASLTDYRQALRVINWGRIVFDPRTGFRGAQSSDGPGAARKDDVRLRAARGGLPRRLAAAPVADQGDRRHDQDLRRGADRQRVPCGAALRSAGDRVSFHRRYSELCVQHHRPPGAVDLHRL